MEQSNYLGANTEQSYFLHAYIMLLNVSWVFRLEFKASDCLQVLRHERHNHNKRPSNVRALIGRHDVDTRQRKGSSLSIILLLFMYNCYHVRKQVSQLSQYVMCGRVGNL